MKKACPGGTPFLFFFLKQLLKQGGIIGRPVRNVVDENGIGNGPVNADIFPGYDIAVTCNAKFIVSGDDPGQGELF